MRVGTSMRTRMMEGATVNCFQVQLTNNGMVVSCPLLMANSPFSTHHILRRELARRTSKKIKPHILYAGGIFAPVCLHSSSTWTPLIFVPSPTTTVYCFIGPNAFCVKDTVFAIYRAAS
jgi:hypothetical protein